MAIDGIICTFRKYEEENLCQNLASMVCIQINPETEKEIAVNGPICEWHIDNATLPFNPAIIRRTKSRDLRMGD